MAEIIRGTEELMKNLEKLGDKLGKALEAAVMAGGLLIQNAAKENVPKVTGNLSRSIHMGGHGGLSELSNSTGADIGGEEKSNEKVIIQVGTDVEYAAFIEFGGSRKAPEGYLRPAMDENKDKVPKEISAALADIVRAV